MSQPREQGEDSKTMAISYASGLPADHTQALPSFRELLPPHLHDEIESTSYFTSRQHPHERPASSLMSERPPYASPSKMPMADSPRDFSAAHPRDHTPVQPRLPQTAGSTPPYASRGPSPILPPIRDLQSLPDRGMNPANAAFPDARGLARPDPYAGAHDMRSGPPPPGHPFAAPAAAAAAANYPGAMGDRRTETYVGANGAQVMHYPYPAMAYQSDSEQTSPPGLSHGHGGHGHGPQSNFGILGDPADSRNKRRRGNLPKPVTDILRAWFHEHLDHPYPSEEDKQVFMSRTGLTISQISNWFINARRRQLPALRNQMRNGGSDLDPQRQSPFSDVEQTSSESMPSPHMLGQS